MLLVSQISVPLKDAAILESLKKSVSQFKKGKAKKVPTDGLVNALCLRKDSRGGEASLKLIGGSLLSFWIG